MANAVVLFSGGLDSTTCLALAKDKGFDCHALSFNYSQRHASELKAAQAIAARHDAKHHIFPLDLGLFGGSALTDNAVAVPDYDAESNDIPITYVPARNTIFLSLALALAEVVDAQDIFLGVSAVDYSGYPDCRPEYIEAFTNMANLATKSAIDGHPVKIHTPLVHLNKAETIRLGMGLGIDYAQTVSCYQADVQGRACGACDSCFLRKKGFSEANVADPTVYI